jgi:iron complex transport system substrate-binding protein
MLFLFVMCLTQGFSVRKIGVSAQKDTKSSDADFYSLSSVRISPSDEPIGTNQNPILVENDYEVTYGSNFKIVRMKCGSKHASLNPSTCDKQTYVLHHRGTERPTVDPVTYANIEAESGGVTTKYFEIPAKNVSVGGSFVLGYLEALGIDGNSGLKMISASYIHSPCMQKAVIAGEIVNEDGYTSDWAAKCDELNIDLALTDSFGTGECSNTPDVNVNFIGNADDTSLLRAEWVKFVSLFFDKEALANEYFALESEAHAAITQYVDKGVVKDGVRLKCVWVRKNWDKKYQILHDKFRSTLCTDAGMDAYSGKDDRLTETYFPEDIELFHSAIRDYDIVIDETYVSDTASRNATDYEATLGFEELSGQTVKAKRGNGGKLLRVDASQGYGNTTDLKESGEVRPALLLMDLVSKAHGTFGSHEDCTKYFRLASESVKYVTNEHCEALEAVDAEKKCVTDLKDEAVRLTPASMTIAEDNSHSASNALSPVFMLAAMMLTVLTCAM